MTGAQTRFNNDQVAAKQQQVSSNPAAVNALRPTGPKRQRPTGPALGENPIVDRDVSQLSPPPPPQTFKPLVQPTQPVVPQEAPDPLAAVKLEKFVSSPEMQKAVTKVRLRDYFHKRDSGLDKGQQILEILGTYRK